MDIEEIEQGKKLFRERKQLEEKQKQWDEEQKQLDEKQKQLRESKKRKRHELLCFGAKARNVRVSSSYSSSGYQIIYDYEY